MQPKRESKLEQNILFEAIIAFVAIAYIPSLGFQFALDDIPQITQNELVIGQAPWWSILTVPTYPGNLYRPLVTLSFKFTYYLFGLNPFYFQLTNILLHLGVVFLIYFIFKDLILRHVALLLAFFFAVHPVCSEVVANIYGRTESLSAFFGLLSIFLIIRRPPLSSEQRLRNYAPFATITYLAALLSKESAITFIPLCFLLDYFLIGKDFRASLSRLSPLLVALLIYLALRAFVFGPTLLPLEFSTSFIDNPLYSLPTLTRALNAIILLGLYLKLAIVPYPLSADYSFSKIKPVLNLNQLANPEILLLAVILVLFLTIALSKQNRTQRTQKLVLFTWFFVAFIVTSNVFFPIGTIFGERLLYVPLIGALGCLLMTFNSLFQKKSGAILICVLGILGAWTTRQHIGVWRNDSTLAMHQLKVSPQSAKTQLNYAVLKRNQGDLKSATHFAQKALQTYPDYSKAAYIQATIAMLLPMESRAKHWLKKAIELDSQNIDAFNLLARIDLNSGNIKKAEEKFQKILKIAPDNYQALLGMLAVKIQSGSKEEVNRLRSVLEFKDPNNDELKALLRVIEK